MSAPPEARAVDDQLRELFDGSRDGVFVSDADGRVFGGHVAPGCIVRTTAEILLAVLDDVRFERAPDPATGHAELVIRPRR